MSCNWIKLNSDDVLQGGLLLPPAAETIVHMMSTLFEVELADKTVGEIAREYFDVDFSESEDCLQLAVSTPLDTTNGIPS